MGGMTEANNAGIPKMRIEQAAARKQARIDSKQDVIIGVNQYILDEEDDLQILEVDNKAVREQQLERLKSVRSNRNEDEVRKSLENLTQAAQTDV